VSGGVKIKRILFFGLTFLLLVTGMQNCFSLSKQSSQSSDPSASGSVVTFAEVNSRILQPYCVQCHANDPGGVNLTTYAEAAMYVLSERPEFSIMYQVVSDDEMPKGGPALSPELKDLLLQWINDGVRP
jgi:uncharacterized membrane protein